MIAEKQQSSTVTENLVGDKETNGNSPLLVVSARDFN
jgi:hypothetical protein